MDALKKLEKLITGTELEIHTMRDGHPKIIGGKVIVDWWPDSKRMTAYVEGSQRGIPYATPALIVKLARGEQS